MDALLYVPHKAELVYEFAKKGNWATVEMLARKFFNQSMLIALHEIENKEVK